MRLYAKLKSTPLCKRLVKKLREAKVPLPDCPDEDFALMGMSPGHWQRSAGAWAWELFWKHDGRYAPARVGSSDPASLIVRKDWTVGGYLQDWGDYNVCGDKIKKDLACVSER